MTLKTLALVGETLALVGAVVAVSETLWFLLRGDVVNGAICGLSAIACVVNAIVLSRC